MEMSLEAKKKIESLIEEIIRRYPKNTASLLITDIHMRIAQETGEVWAVDDEETELCRCVIDEWIGGEEDDFHAQVGSFLRTVLNEMSVKVEELGILKPYSFVMEDEEGDYLAELFVVDGDTVILGGDLLPNLETELDSFLKTLFDE